MTRLPGSNVSKSGFEKTRRSIVGCALTCVHAFGWAGRFVVIRKCQIDDGRSSLAAWSHGCGGGRRCFARRQWRCLLCNARGDGCCLVLNSVNSGVLDLDDILVAVIIVGSPYWALAPSGACSVIPLHDWTPLSVRLDCDLLNGSGRLLQNVLDILVHAQRMVSERLAANRTSPGRGLFL